MSIKPVFKKYGCDKSSRHRYHLIYDRILDQYDAPRILEIGVLRGDSTLSFMEYKPKAKIVGVDVFTRISLKQVRSRFARRSLDIPLYTCDSTDSVAVKKAMENVKEKFDIIIDDAAHFPDTNRETLINFMPYLSDNGIYVIEDIFPVDIMTPEEFQHPWIIKNPLSYTIEKYTNFLNEVNKYNNVKHYDHRSKTRMPDSYMITLTK